MTKNRPGAGTRLVLGAVVAFFAAIASCGSDAITTASTTTLDADSTTIQSTTTQSTTVQPSTAQPTTVQPTTSGSTTPSGASSQTVSVFFSSGDGSDCAQVSEHQRTIPAEADPIRSAFDRLVGGPSDVELNLGSGSFFSPSSANTIRSATLEDGSLRVDFDDIRSMLTNASTSCGSAALLAQLNSTALQFESVERVRYTIEGGCDRFMNWLQRECVEFDRAGEVSVSTNERAEGSGCTPGGTELADGRWFGFVSAASTDNVIFDLACWFTGPAAVRASEEDGEESPPPNDYYVRNDVDVLRQVELGPSVEVEWLPEPGDPTTMTTVSYPTWVDERLSRDYQPGIWMNVVDGVVESIAEQYTP